MVFSGTFLTSTVAKRIAFILALTLFIPTALITNSASNSIDELIQDYAHQQLVSTSQNYALTSFSNLQLARGLLANVASAQQIDSLLTNKNDYRKPIFISLRLVLANGKTLKASGLADYHDGELKKVLTDLDLSKKHSRIVALPVQNDVSKSSYLLILPKISQSLGQYFIVGELDPTFIWGNKEDYPADVSVCVYSGKQSTQNKLFCSGKQLSLNPYSSFKSKENKGSWELFLAAEFQTDSWLYVTQRLEPLNVSSATFVSNFNFFKIAALSLLLVALLGLIQIRRTMVPLERLMKGTRNLTKGDFSPVQVDGHSEFTELASAFNGMSANLKKQMDKLQTLSRIDLEIATKLDVKSLIAYCFEIIKRKFSETDVFLLELHPSDNRVDVQLLASSCNCQLQPFEMTIQDVDTVKTFTDGYFIDQAAGKEPALEKVGAKLNLQHGVLFPLLWQGELVAMLCISSASYLDPLNENWQEVHELSSRISLAISAQEREKKLVFQAQYDDLTQLPNRSYMQTILDNQILSSQLSGNTFCLAFLDLDHFKFINDSLGHKTGDLFLIEIANRLRHVLQDENTVARFGGDEFIVIINNQQNRNAVIGVLNSIIESVAQPYIIENKEMVSTCSIGAAFFPGDATDGVNLIGHADIAMYHAKKNGKNNVQFFDQSMNKHVAERLLLEQQLRKALQNNEFRLVYQPKVNVQSGFIVGMEALIRWHSKDLGFVSPQQFIPLAEETGLIIPIGEWVLRTACAQAAQWNLAGMGKLLMSVNISGRQFKQLDLIESIHRALLDTGLDPSNLELELTESLFMDDIQNSILTMQRIRQIGVQISVDDFGTGYSSLAYLKKFPLNTLKVDKSFIDDIHMADDDAPIVASILSLAKNLGLKVVAEGVESVEQTLYLKAHHCDEIQGYYFYRPESAEAMEKILISNLQPLSSIQTHQN